MNTNQKGVRGLIKIIDNLQENGYYCFPAFDDHSPVDIIALDKAGKTFRLQVKYKKDAKAELSACSVVNGKKIPINRELIDGWAIYFEESKKVVYLHKNLMDGRKTMVIDSNEINGAWAGW